MDIIVMYVEERKSIPQISALTNIPQSNIRYALKKKGVLRSRTDGVRVASESGRLGSGLRGKKRVFTEQWKQRISIGKKLASVGISKGVSRKPSGYIEYTTGPNKGRSVHVVAMEQQIGRRLYANEVVHHIDENRSNNDLSNLKLMTRSEHTSHHAKQRSKHGKR
jgi:hypothetical protein